MFAYVYIRLYVRLKCANLLYFFLLSFHVGIRLLTKLVRLQDKFTKQRID